MKRRHNGGDVDHFDLFPFISILVCTLGFLLMVTLAVVAICLGPGARQIIIPEALPGQIKREPLMIEWDGSQVTIHPSGTKVSWAEASKNEGVNDSPFGQLLLKVRQEKARYYIFVAVRPSGFGNLGQLVDLMHKQKLNFGYEPFEQGRPIGIQEEGKQI